ncbi:MAG: proton-conducting transporter membrane subunit [Ignisphaera sp.]
MYNHIVSLIPFVPAVIAVLIPIVSIFIRSRWLIATLQLVATGSIFLFSIKILLDVIDRGVVVYPFGGWPPPIGIVYTVDFINAIYGVIATSIALITSIYCFWYFKVVDGPTWLSTLLLLLIAGVTGCIYTGDIFNFFVMLEVLAISSYVLVAFFKKRRWAIEAAASYSFIGVLATTFFLFGVAYLYLSFGTLNMADIASKSNNIEARMLSTWSGVCRDGICFGNIQLASAMALAFMLWALTFEAGLFPNNYWLPSAYTEAPTPASAMFAGVVDKVGAYGILRLFITIFSPYSSILLFKLWSIPFRDIILYMLSFLGFLTGLLGGLLMTIQKDVKRFLSYSTISHIGLLFIVMAGLASNQNEDAIALTVAALLFHSITHAFGESMLFIGLGTLATTARSRRIRDLYGYGRIYPGISIAIAIGSLSLLGVAPLAGFFSKYMLFLSMINGGFIFYAISIIVISGITAIGYFKLIYALFILKPSKIEKADISLPTHLCLSMATILVVLGILFIQGTLYSFLISNAKIVSSVNGIKQYIKSVEDIAKFMGGIP